jgi:hypothetical protein
MIVVMAPLREDIAAAKKRMMITFGSNRELRLLVTYLHGGEQVEAICSGKYSNGRGVIVLTNERVFFLKDGWFKKTTQDFPFYSISSVEWQSRILFGDIVLFSDGSQATITKVPANTGKRLVGLIRERAGKRGTGWGGNGGGPQPSQGFQQPPAASQGFSGFAPQQQNQFGNAPGSSGFVPPRFPQTGSFPAQPQPASEALPKEPASQGPLFSVPQTQKPQSANAGGASDDIAGQLERLDRLFKSGILTEAELAAAKQRVIG